MNIDSKKIQSIIIITIVITIAGAVMTQSLFRDVEKSDQGEFAMGTLDLAVNEENGSIAQAINIVNVGEKNSLSGSKAWKVRNNGSLPGRLTVAIENLMEQENGCNEPESLVDASCDDPGVGVGELGSAIRIELAMMSSNETTSLISTDLSPQSPVIFQQAWDALPQRIELLPGQERIFILSWEIDGGDQSNRLQSDSLKFDMVFLLNQIIN